jgi:adenylosuccinate synthase
MDILLGLQWGDEGKGKIVDFFAPRYDIVVRFQGGPNAGHTLEFDGKKAILQQIPSGIFHPQISNVIASGVVLDVVVLKKELEKLKAFGLNPSDNLFISRKVTLILPTHRLLDAASEKQKGDKKIGSTLKGIGPTYQDKIGRQALKMGMTENKDFLSFYSDIRSRHLEILGEEPQNLKELEESFFEALESIKPIRLIDSEYFINESLRKGKKVLAEGAQGTLLDVDFGSYPFVTSSNTFAGGACTGSGVPPQQIRETFGIFKAYCTRVGSGPFPTELSDEMGDWLRKNGNEFGAVTGRPRRTGWLDLPALKYAVMINGVTSLIMTKGDVLNGLETIKVCTHYRLEDGTITDKMPFDLVNTSLEPLYATLEGWKEDTRAVKTLEQLPQSFRHYVDFLESELQVPIKIISTGPDRSHTILRD